MTKELNDLQLAEMYRAWWKEMYGLNANSQATVIAIAWARHVLSALAQADD
jgi:hypothetical protein